MNNKTPVLEGLFDSDIKVKLLKLFLRNPEEKFTLDDITERTQSDPSSIRYQLRKLREIKFIKSALVRFPSKQEDKQKGRKRRVYFANPNFSLLTELQELILKPMPVNKQALRKKLTKLGDIKLAVLSGILVGQEDARTDLLIVGEDLESKDKEFKNIIKEIEADLGQRLRYTRMTEKDFNYRVDMYDNFIKRIFKEPHEVLIKEISIPF